MKIEFNNLYTHFIFTTIHREPIILEAFRERVEKYITGTVNNNECQLYAIYANPEHLHFLVSRSPTRSEESLAEIVANSSANFINKIKFCKFCFLLLFANHHIIDSCAKCPPVLNELDNPIEYS